MATTTKSGGGVKLLLALGVIAVIGWFALDMMEFGPAHTDNGNQSARQEVEFWASWAPEQEVVIAYLVNMTGDQDRRVVGPWSHSELAYRHSVYHLEVHPTEPMSYIECEIWVDGKREAHARVTGGAACSIRADMR